MQDLKVSPKAWEQRVWDEFRLGEGKIPLGKAQEWALAQGLPRVSGPRDLDAALASTYIVFAGDGTEDDPPVRLGALVLHSLASTAALLEANPLLKRCNIISAHEGSQRLSPLLANLLCSHIRHLRQKGGNDSLIAQSLGLLQEGESFMEAMSRYQKVDDDS